MNEQLPEPSEGPADSLLMREWDVPHHAHLAPILLALSMTGIWLLNLPQVHPDIWYLSWNQIASGQVVPVFAHMLAHLNLVHLGLNMIGLMVIGGPLIACFGSPPVSSARFLYLFTGAGVAGGLLFVTVNQDATPVIGASGAIFGILGALARVHPATGMLVPVGSKRTWLMTKFFISNHAILFVLAAVVAVLSGQAQSLAWEAHFGGLLFGFFAAPLFLGKAAERPR
ncbi:rhomboid family intramembrane serine protease [Parafrankia sp. BMG5.11]|nr:rhomboid family intramembrane serine protease [Parafrankia sp. BMG5.11]